MQFQLLDGGEGEVGLMRPTGEANEGDTRRALLRNDEMSRIAVVRKAREGGTEGDGGRGERDEMTRRGPFVWDNGEKS